MKELVKKYVKEEIIKEALVKFHQWNSLKSREYCESFIDFYYKDKNNPKKT